MKLRNIILLLLSLFACVSCEKEEVAVRGGSYQFKGTTYPIKNVRIEHVGYSEDDCVLRFMTYPATIKYANSSLKGYGAVIDAYFVVPSPRFSNGKENPISSSVDTLESVMTVYPENTETQDTVLYKLQSGELLLDTVNGTNKFDFQFLDSEGDTLSGTYFGDYTYNIYVDQPEYGSLSFDSINCGLTTPVMWCWNHLFSENLNYFELVFYSSDARFSDDGSFRSGVQMVVGINDVQELYPSVSEYIVDLSPDKTKTILFGHKVNNTSWGTYWQVYESGSAVGKANIIADSARIISIDDKNINIQFNFKDQLSNRVVGKYEGPYITKSFK